MNATILNFPIERTAGYSANVPSLKEMALLIKSHFFVLDDIDQRFFALIDHNMLSGDKMGMDVIMECRSIAWTIICRNGLNQERAGG